MEWTVKSRFGGLGVSFFDKLTGPLGTEAGPNSYHRLDPT